MAGFLGRIIQGYMTRLSNRLIGVKNMFFGGGVVMVIGMISVWISIFLYVAFYYAYMPAVLHARPVHLQFKPCEETKGLCSFPTAHVQLTKKQQLLMIGQQYRIYLHLEMPESPANQKLGMFMVCAHLEDKAGTLVSNACRSAMLHYRSQLLHTMLTLMFAPFMLFGSTEEKQMVAIELFSGFEEDPAHPVTDIFVEIQSRHAEIYSSELRVTAHLTGLRHLMFNWPTFSAGIGIVSILFFLAVLIALSLCHQAFRSDLSSSLTAKRSSFFQGKSWITGEMEDRETEEEEEEESSTKDDLKKTRFFGDTDDMSSEEEMHSDEGETQPPKRSTGEQPPIETLR